MTRDEMIEQWRIAMYPGIDAPTFLAHLADTTATGWDDVRREIDTLEKLAALRAPAVTGEAAEPLMVRAAHDRDTRPWRYYQLDAATLQKMCEHLADKLAAFEAKTHQDSLQNAASPAAGAPPALVALVQRWQKARLAVRDAEDHEAYSMAEQLLDIHERALLAWSSAPAPVAPPAETLRACSCLGSCNGPNRLSPAYRCAITQQAGTAAPVAPPAEDVVCRNHAQDLRDAGILPAPKQSAPPAVAGGDAPEEADDVCECGHTRKAHCWTDGKHRCYHGRCQCWSFRRRQEGQ